MDVKNYAVNFMNFRLATIRRMVIAVASRGVKFGQIRRIGAIYLAISLVASQIDAPIGDARTRSKRNTHSVKKRGGEHVLIKISALFFQLGSLRVPFDIDT